MAELGLNVNHQQPLKTWPAAIGKPQQEIAPLPPTTVIHTVAPPAFFTQAFALRSYFPLASTLFYFRFPLDNLSNQLPPVVSESQTPQKPSPPPTSSRASRSPTPLSALHHLSDLLSSSFPRQRAVYHRSLKTRTRLQPLNTHFPRVTPVTPSLCPSKTSRPTVCSLSGARILSSTRLHHDTLLARRWGPFVW